MEDTFLSKIKTYVKENNIPFDKIPIKYSLMPKGFKEFALKGLKSANIKYDTSKELDCFEVCFDKNKNPYIKIPGFDETTVIVRKEGIEYADLLIGRKYTEEQMISLSNRWDITIAEEAIKTAGLDPRWIKTPDEVESMREVLSKTSDKICEYMKYLFKEYKLAKEANVLHLFYIEPDTATVIRTLGKGIPTIKIERRHKELTLEERLDTLESHPYVYSAIADSSSSYARYRIYLYNVLPTDNYRMVLEPELGTKYTKISFMKANAITEEEFKKEARKVLEMSRDDITESKTVSRLAHTTIENFKNSVNYVLGDEEADIHPNNKCRIKRYIAASNK